MWKPEVLAPAGAPECLPAAVAGGADAVYLGLRHFNARGRAENFRLADLPDHVAYLHEHGVKAYMVLNTLLHDDEFDKAVSMAEQAYAAGIDAALIQDLGLWHALRRYVPGLELHASTQMTVHCKSQIACLAEMGAARIVLARELSFAELKELTAYAASLQVETEHFVHGALCYAFSGQCLMSNFSGCRSANRGTCAQNCRFDYQRDQAGEFDTEISMKDLSLLQAIPRMADAGVASLKIEGRLKGPDYVYTVAKAFRQAVDAWAEHKQLDKQAAANLDKVFSRGLSSAPLDGVYDRRSRLQRAQERAHGDTQLLRLHRTKGQALLACREQPQVGNGYAFTVGQFRDGFQILSVEQTQVKNQWQCRVRINEHGPVPSGPIPAVVNSDQAFQKQVQAALRQAPPMQRSKARRAIQLRLNGAVDQPLIVEALLDGETLSCQSEQVLAVAQKQALTLEAVEKSLAAFGNSNYRCIGIDWRISGDVFLPAKQLKQLRRQLICLLDAMPASDPLPARHICVAAKDIKQKHTNIIVAVNSVAAAEAALAAGADEAWLDDPLLQAWAAERPHVKLPERVKWRHPPTQALSPHLACFTNGVVGGHIGVLRQAQADGVPAVADVYCNVVNSFCLEALGALGVEAAVLSLELSAREILRLVGRLVGRDVPKQILYVHGRVPSMLTRQDHGLAPGAVMQMQAHQRDGGLPYEIQHRLGHDTIIWEGRRLLATEAVASTRGLLDAWLLDLSDCVPETVASFSAKYVALRDGNAGAAQAINAMAAQTYQYPCFPGHLETGSRALDDWQAAQAQ